MQRVSSLERKKEVASGRRGSACGHTTKGIAKRVEEESSAHSTMEGTGALWRGHPRQGIPVRAGVVYKGGDSVICGVQKVWTERMLGGGE